MRKPSEMSFYSGLGLPCIIAPPVGAHERYNRRWLREQGVGLKQRRLDHASTMAVVADKPNQRQIMADPRVAQHLRERFLLPAAGVQHVPPPRPGQRGVAEALPEALLIEAQQLHSLQQRLLLARRQVVSSRQRERRGGRRLAEDGRQQRNLSASELAQIAGRADEVERGAGGGPEHQLGGAARGGGLSFGARLPG
mgnify:CR=1 FL=1